jgi:hypothetical protein
MSTPNNFSSSTTTSKHDNRPEETPGARYDQPRESEKAKPSEGSSTFNQPSQAPLPFHRAPFPISRAASSAVRPPDTQGRDLGRLHLQATLMSSGSKAAVEAKEELRIYVRRKIF